MPEWTISAPTTLDFDGVVALRIRVVAGSVAVLSGDRPRLDVTSIAGKPPQVSYEGGILTIGYPELTWEGLGGWRPKDHHEVALTVTVPPDCPVQVGAVRASTVISGIEGRAAVRSVSGGITLDGLTGGVKAGTVSGHVEALGLSGELTFRSVSGDLTLADATVSRLDARTVNGKITADLAAAASEVRVSTVSGPVTVRLPAAVSARIALRSTSGRLLSEFGGLTGTSGTGAHTLAGTIGGGAGEVSVSTLSGRVTLLERPADPAPGQGRDGGAADGGAVPDRETPPGSERETASAGPASAAEVTP